MVYQENFPCLQYAAKFVKYSRYGKGIQLPLLSAASDEKHFVCFGILEVVAIGGGEGGNVFMARVKLVNRPYLPIGKQRIPHFDASGYLQGPGSIVSGVFRYNYFLRCGPADEGACEMHSLSQQKS